MRTNFSRDFVQQSVALLVALGGAFVAVQGHAGTASDTMTVSATVEPSCTINVTTALAFGVYDPIVTNANTPLDGTGVITTTCTTGAAVNVTLGQGNNAGGGSTAAAPVRQLSSGPDLLPYALYSDSARSVLWAGTALTGLDDTGDGTPKNLSVYGRIPQGANVPTGSYGDVVTATVNF